MYMYRVLRGKLKRKLDRNDILINTKLAYERISKVSPELILSLEKTHPEFDIEANWLSEFENVFVNAISKGETKESQAAICRSLLLFVKEHLAIKRVILKFSENEEAVAILAKLFYLEFESDEYTEASVMQLVLRKWIIGLINNNALEELYFCFFNHTLNLDGFSDEYSLICELEAETRWRVGVGSAFDNIKTKIDYNNRLAEKIYNPAYDELYKIKSDYELNLRKPRPSKPSNCFEEWRLKYLDALDELSSS